MKTAILLIAHGSRRPEANDDLRYFAERLREKGHSDVVASYLELEPPNIEEGGRLCAQTGAERVVMLPFFLSPGTHVHRDLTQSRANLGKEFPDVEFLLAEPLGRHPLVIDILQDRIRQQIVADGPTNPKKI